MSKYSIAIAAVDKFTSPFRAFSDVNARLVDELKLQQSELRNLKDAQRDLGTHNKLTQKLSDTTLALQQAKQAQSALALEMNAAEIPSQKLTQQYEKAKVKSAQLSAEHAIQTNELNKLENKLSKAGVNTKEFSSEQDRLTHATERANAELQTQQARIKSVTDAQNRVNENRQARAELRGEILETAALAYVAAKPIKQAINFESSMADVKKVVSFDNSAEAENMGQDILKMSTKMPMAAEGIAQIVSAAGQAGIAKAELLDFAQSATKMSVAFNTSAADAGSTMAAWRAAMGLTQEQTIALADAANHLGNTINATAPDIAAVLKRQGAVAMSAGFSEVQAAALSGAILSTGATEQVAATALKNITLSLMKGDNATAQQREAWAELGLDPGELTEDMLTNAPETLIRVFEALQDVPEEQVTSLVSQLFGESAIGAVMPMIKNLDNLKKAFDATSDASKYHGSMNAEYQARIKTTGSNLQLLSNTFDRLQISLGTLLLPVLNSILIPTAQFLDCLSDAAAEYPRVAKIFTLTATGLVALKVGALALKYTGLLFGQSLNVVNLGRAKLAATTAFTTKNANLATIALTRMNAALGRTSTMSAVGAGMGGIGGGAGSLKGLGKFLRPLGIALAAGTLLSAFSGSNDSPNHGAEVGGAVGNVAGGAGGWMAGAAAGAALGSMVPIIGTAFGGVIGGLVGSFAGGELGGWLGEKIGGTFDNNDSSYKPDVFALRQQNTEVNKNADLLDLVNDQNKQHAKKEDLLFDLVSDKSKQAAKKEAVLLELVSDRSKQSAKKEAALLDLVSDKSKQSSKNDLKNSDKNLLEIKGVNSDAPTSGTFGLAIRKTDAIENKSPVSAPLSASTKPAAQEKIATTPESLQEPKPTPQELRITPVHELPPHMQAAHARLRKVTTPQPPPPELVGPVLPPKVDDYGIMENQGATIYGKQTDKPNPPSLSVNAASVKEHEPALSPANTLALNEPEPVIAETQIGDYGETENQGAVIYGKQKDEPNPSPLSANAAVVKEPDPLSTNQNILGWLGDKLSSVFIDKLPSSEQVKDSIKNVTDSRQIHFSPSITINNHATGQNNNGIDPGAVDALIERLKSELLPILGGGDLGVRLDASLSDGGH